MAGNRNLKREDGREFHVGDAHIWAAIYYLDSVTGYREYLSTNVRLDNGFLGEPMVLLDDFPAWSFWTSLRFRLRQHERDGKPRHSPFSLRKLSLVR